MKIDDEIVNRIREKWSVINDIPSLLLLLNEIKSDVLLIDNELITKKKLLKFADLNNGNRYITFLVKKKSGKNRIINAPNDIEFLIILKCVNVLMSIIYLPHTNAKGFARGQSVKDNAEIHVNNAFVFNIDIIDFFNNLHQKDFIDFLHKRDYLISNHFSDTLIDIFSQLCFFKKNANIILPQGSPTSPIISNMLCHDLDICLTELAAKFQINYSRYADDITFSSNVNVFEINGELRNELVQNLQKYKFEINPSKTRVQSISERQEVTGIIVNQKLNVNKKFIKTIRMLLYYWESYGQDKANSIYLSYINSKTQNKKKKVNVKKVIEGKLAFLKMIKGEEDSVYKLLKKRYLNLIDPTTKILEISTKIETRLNLKSKIEKVNYTSRISDCFDSYPIIRFPKKDSIIRSYRNGKKNKKGVTEVFFYNELKKHFPTFLILNDISITIGNDKRPYEPDIAIINRSNTCIRIDIEIDEPYAGISRQITHCSNDDLIRDNYFVERGWIVIRFSEYQVFKHSKSCSKYIALVLMSILNNTPLPFDLLKEVDLKNEMKWDDIQAKIWESENYREKYLNINFSGIESEENISFNLKFNDQELIEERLIHKNTHNNISILNENLNSTNSINDSLVKQKSEFSTKSHGINNQNKKNKEDDKSSSSIYKIGCLMFIFIFIVINLFTFLTKSCVDAILH